MNHVIEHRGCQLSYTVSGEGSPILFIQGVGVQGAAWQPQTDELAKDHRCIYFDNRGMGKSQPVAGELTVSQMADDAKAILEAEGISSAHIVGHSLGGLVALDLALNHRELVQSLSLLCTFPGGKIAAPLTFRMMWLGMRSRIGTRKMRRKGFMQLVLAPNASVDPAGADRLAELFGHDLADQPSIVNPQLRAMRKANFETRLNELAGLPTLVVSATFDPIAPPKVGRILAEGITGSRFVEIPNASHGLPISHPELVNRLLQEHLSEKKVPYEILANGLS